MSFTPTTVKFNLDLPPRDSTGPINEFGQHKYVVLREIIQQPGMRRSELGLRLIMNEAQMIGALNKLLDADMVFENAGNQLFPAQDGVEKFNAL